MKIVIDIDEKVYGLLKYFEEALGLNDKKDSNEDVKTALMRAVINGEVLPKEHGKIVDIGRIDKDKMEQDNPIIYITMNDEYIEAVSLDYLNNLPAIIEADNEEEPNASSD